MNCVNIIGNIVREPELKSTSTGKNLCNITIAVNNYNNDGMFFDCVAFGKTADIINQYCVKGSKIGISGELSQNSWTDNDGKKRSKINIIIARIDLLNKKTETHEQQSFSEKTPLDDDLPF